ncbi:hypothetical protein PULV_b0236 [Pseudoalteromonas ulvae UL12]|nr:hypothetical protein [Pseudoalteromonas ulvae UL12]
MYKSEKSTIQFNAFFNIKNRVLFKRLLFYILFRYSERDSIVNVFKLICSDLVMDFYLKD